MKLLRRGVHRSVTALEHHIRSWIQQWNTNPRPYVWTRTAEYRIQLWAQQLGTAPTVSDARIRTMLRP